MPRGKYYPEEVREEARRLRREGRSLGEISEQLGPPKNTLTLWVRGVELTLEQRERILAREVEAARLGRISAAKVNRAARLARIDVERQKAQVFFDTLTDQHRVNQVAAAMLYTGEGAKSENAFAFANSNPQVIRYWVYLLRTSFNTNEAKFRLQLMTRADQDIGELMQFWTNVTGITQYIKGSVDPRTVGKPTERPNYKGVCSVHYHDVSFRRYLDALARGLMERAVGPAG